MCDKVCTKGPACHKPNPPKTSECQSAPKPTALETRYFQKEPGPQEKLETRQQQNRKDASQQTGFFGHATWSVASLHTQSKPFLRKRLRKTKSVLRSDSNSEVPQWPNLSLKQAWFRLIYRFFLSQELSTRNLEIAIPNTKLAHSIQAISTKEAQKDKRAFQTQPQTARSINGRI